jgi:hypothetical protein
MSCVQCGQFHKRMYKREQLCRLCYRKKPNINSKEKLTNALYRVSHRNVILKKKKEQYAKNIVSERKIRVDYEKQRMANDLGFKIRKNLRTRLKNAMRRGNTTANIKLHDNNIVFDMVIIKQQLESKFKPGMTWDNYGEWEIDHIDPLCSFDLSNIDEVRRSCSPINLQPIWYKDHIIKTVQDIKKHKASSISESKYHHRGA